MLKSLFLAASLVSLAAMPANAAPCRDAKGKFIKCATAAPVKAKRCKLNGKFAKCTTPGAKPI